MCMSQSGPVIASLHFLKKDQIRLHAAQGGHHLVDDQPTSQAQKATGVALVNVVTRNGEQLGRY